MMLLQMQQALTKEEYLNLNKNCNGMCKTIEEVTQNHLILLEPEMRI